jgi:hypothetical protein
VKLDDKEGESHLDSSSELPEGVIVIHAWTASGRCCGYMQLRVGRQLVSDIWRNETDKT